ncbi:putative Double-stranded-RNA-binding protein 4 [Hibiscus syriacus]|uniref:Double-stranded-RNA-binding protein 4 n=1 Tax=Hibiscus syriacus TaxID=106335 RepID=A0A6A3BP90_HIBSY|nr:steroid 5-alpha-reductase DET2-like [Hibiscus syriacus]KAE8717897.1 putative Double-stranded-RNA-binding protein 4 [Hibiscus syriacus]
MAIPMVLGVLFPPRLAITAASVLALTSLGILGFLEIRGIHLKYSKFSNAAASSISSKVPSRVGMFFLYTPAFLAGVASFWLFPDGDLRFLLLKSAITIHFFKRVFEVAFIHKYSGEMGIDSMIIISVSYFFLSFSLIYTQLLTLGLPEPSIDLKNPGIALFLIGISGNFYHHYLLSKLREEGGKGYKIPRGGLFGMVICPHYLFEILGLLGISLISQTLYSLSATLGSAFYLVCRSYVTRRWYISKFEDFPKEVKALIPYVF